MLQQSVTEVFNCSGTEMVVAGISEIYDLK